MNIMVRSLYSTFVQELDVISTTFEIFNENDLIDSTESSIDQLPVPTQQVYPLQLAVPNQKIDPVQLAVPTQYVDPVQLAVPTQQVYLLQLAVPTQYVDPVQLAVPTQYVDPVQLDDPTQQVNQDQLTDSTNKLTIEKQKSVRIKRSDWKNFEDLLIRQFILQNFELYLSKKRMSWKIVAKQINDKFYGGEVIRSGRNCSERWTNHLNPNLKSKRYLEGEWTNQEDVLLLLLYIKHKGCLSSISKNMRGRTQDYVKNRFKKLKNEYLKKRSAEKEDVLLLLFYIQHKGCWSSISRELPGITEDSVKNRFKKLKIEIKKLKIDGIH